MRHNFEYSKMKPLCSTLITRSVDCDMQCPYRHTLLDNCNHTGVPELGYVNMELLSVLAPNHFAVRVIGHKRRLEHKSKSLECLTSDWEQFEKRLREHYTNAMRENLEPIEIGDMCLIFHQSQPKRCRVISKEKNCVSVFLIDIGRIRNYRADQLYRLDVKFYDYPAQAIEIYVLGYLPADYSHKWLPEAKDYTKSLMNSLKEERKTQNYLQAEVIKGFERTLLVKNLKMCFKGKHLATKSVSQKLIKSGFAEEAPIVLHEIFLDQNTDNDTEINSEILINSKGHETNSPYTMQVSRPPSSDGIQVTSLEYCENPPKVKMVYTQQKQKRNSETSTPASLDDCNDVGIGSKTDIDVTDWDEIDAKGFIATSDVGTSGGCDQKATQTAVLDLMEMPLDVNNMPFIDFGTDVGPNGKFNQNQNRVLSLDEIFGSLPECAQATNILQPIRCYPNGAPSNDNQATEPEAENTTWLIDFDD